MSEENKTSFSLAKGSTEVLKGKDDGGIGYTGVLTSAKRPEEHYEGSIPVNQYQRAASIEVEKRKPTMGKMVVPLLIILVLLVVGLKFLGVF